jgi:signal transduction histidine kinase
MADSHLSFPATKTASRRPSVPVLPLLSGLIMIAAIGIFAYVTQLGVSNSRNWVLHSYQVNSQLQTLQTQFAGIRANALAYAESGDTGQLIDFRARVAAISSLIENLRRMTIDNSRQQYRLGELQNLSGKYLTELEDMVIAPVPRTSVPPAEIGLIRDLDAQESRLDGVVQSMLNDERGLADNRLAVWNRLFRRYAVILALTLVAALLFLAYSHRLLIGEVARTQEMERLQRENVRSSRALSARVLELQDAERRKVARELHDSVGQYLVALKINLDQLHASGSSLDPGQATLLAETLDLIERSIAEVRTISHLLHPPLLDEMGFESAARWYAEGFAKRCGLHVNLRLSQLAERFPKEVELALFRVLQESLTNVHRHAHAKSIDIVLICADGRATLTVHDDGCGISRDMVSRFRSGLASGVGLAGMRERLAELNGTLEVEPRARGTAVRAVIPIVERSHPLSNPMQTTAV